MRGDVSADYFYEPASFETTDISATELRRRIRNLDNLEGEEFEDDEFEDDESGEAISEDEESEYDEFADDEFEDDESDEAISDDEESEYDEFEDDEFDFLEEDSESMNSSNQLFFTSSNGCDLLPSLKVSLPIPSKQDLISSSLSNLINILYPLSTGQMNKARKVWDFCRTPQNC